MYRGSQEGGLSFCRTVVSFSSPLPKRTTLGALHWAKKAAAAKMIRDLRAMDSSRRIINSEPVLPVSASVFDSNAPQFPAPVTNLGLPWMKNDSDSAGPGKKHGIGSGIDGGMGDDKGPGAGRGESYDGPYANVVSLPRCAYCPDPQYTDEGREAKLQGKVMLQVLVGADGRSEEHTSELQSPCNLVCRLLLEKKNEQTRPVWPVDKQNKEKNRE